MPNRIRKVCYVISKRILSLGVRVGQDCFLEELIEQQTSPFRRELEERGDLVDDLPAPLDQVLGRRSDGLLHLIQQWVRPLWSAGIIQ